MKCRFCGRELPPIGALKYVKKNGESIWFCCSKCEKSFLIGRDSRKQKWVTKHKK